MKGTRLDESWRPTPEMFAWAKTELGFAQQDAEFHTDAFIDHWCDKTGAAATKITWVRTWKNWMRKEYLWQRRTKPFKPASHAPATIPQRKSDTERRENLALHLPDLFKQLGIV